MTERIISEYAVRLGKDAIRFIRILPSPIETVWDYLTVPDKRALWLAGGETSTEIGGKAIFEFDHSKLTNHDEEIPEKYRTPDGKAEFDPLFVGEVLLFIPPSRLKVTWPDSNDTGSTLDISLTQRKNHVELILFHEKIPSDEFMCDILAGWHAHLDVLQDRLEGIEPRPFWENNVFMEKKYKNSKLMS